MCPSALKIFKLFLTAKCNIHFAFYTFMIIIFVFCLANVYHYRKNGEEKTQWNMIENSDIDIPHDTTCVARIYMYNKPLMVIKSNNKSEE